MTKTMGSRTVNGIWTIAVVLLGSTTGCTLLLDSTSVQCQVDADCNQFAGHPACQAGVCVASGLGPDGCIPDPPSTQPDYVKTQSDYINACSTSKCVAFNNCDHLGLCNSTQLPMTQDPTNATIPPLVVPVPKPTVMCDDGTVSMIYLLGSSDFQALLKAVQPSLSANSPPYRAVFQSSSSCAGVSAIFDPTKRVMKDPVIDTNGGWAYYFDNSGNQVNCLLDPAGTPNPQGKVIDVGISDLYAPTCNTQYVPGLAVAEYLGPVVPFVLSVPATAAEPAISAEALHMVFGLGGKAPAGSGMKDASPWIDPNSYFIRNSGGASTVLTSLLSDVPRTKFWGIDRLTTENLRDSLLASTATNSSIGILSIDYNDKNRDNLRALYLQGKGQMCGYQPDSSPTTYDKSNVRDGHYLMWGYVHFFTQLGPGGVPSPAAGAMVLRFRVPRIEQRLLDDIILASLTPRCAMKVVRDTEVGDFTAQTGFQCGCYFDLKTRGKNSCQACATSDDCPTTRHACNYGFCELN